MSANQVWALIRKGETNQQHARHVASERSCSEKETLGPRNLLEVERWEDPPTHKLEVEVDSLRSKSWTVRGKSAVNPVQTDWALRGVTYFIGSIVADRSTILGPKAPFSFLSHPTAFNGPRSGKALRETLARLLASGPPLSAATWIDVTE